MAVRLFVGNLPYNATEADLREHFSEVGPVAGVWVATDRETGRPRGFAFVEYEDRAAAEEAVRRFNNKPFGGRALAVNEARPQERGSSPPPPRRPMSSSSSSSGPPRPSYQGGGPLLPPDAPPEDAAGRGGTRDRSRNFGPDAPRQRVTKKKTRDRDTAFDKPAAPKRPIRVASGGRFLSSDDFENFDDEENLDEFGVEIVEEEVEVDGEVDAEGDAEGEGDVEGEGEGDVDGDEPSAEPSEKEEK
jgi:RNA recognition motif-containing protein